MPFLINPFLIWKNFHLSLLVGLVLWFGDLTIDVVIEQLNQQ